MINPKPIKAIRLQFNHTAVAVVAVVVVVVVVGVDCGDVNSAVIGWRRGEECGNNGAAILIDANRQCQRGAAIAGSPPPPPPPPPLRPPSSPLSSLFTGQFTKMGTVTITQEEEEGEGEGESRQTGRYQLRLTHTHTHTHTEKIFK